jgi:hypothetical protein
MILSMANTNFDGVTFEKERDGVRLAGQLLKVFEIMRDGNPRTLNQLADAVGGSEAGVSARLRDLKKDRFGGHIIQKRHLGNGLWQYRLIMAQRELR